MRYGFVGVGHLGAHLATSLVKGGFEVGVYDVQRSAAEGVLASGAEWEDSIETLAARCDALITCLPSPAATEAVVDAALPSMRAGGCWIEMSTNDFAKVGALADRVAAVGVATLVCPVTGGVHRAAAGDITVLVGGAHHIFAAHEAALQAMGGKVLYVGGIQQAAVTKVATNMLAFIHLIAAAKR